MENSPSWLEQRRMILRDIAAVFSERTGISEHDFISIFYDSPSPPPIGDFNSQYIPESSLLDEVFTALGDRTGLESEKIRSHFDTGETFAQFGEHLLRAGAYAEEP